MLHQNSMIEPRPIWNTPPRPPLPEPSGTSRVKRLLVHRWTVDEFEVPVRKSDKETSVLRRDPAGR